MFSFTSRPSPGAVSYTHLDVYKRQGMLCVDSGVEHANCEAAQQAILAELDKLCTGPIEPRELDETKRALKNALISVGDSLQAAENWYLGCLLRGADETPAQGMEEVQAGTADDVRSGLGAFGLSVAYRITKGLSLIHI